MSRVRAAEEDEVGGTSRRRQEKGSSCVRTGSETEEGSSKTSCWRIVP